MQKYEKITLERFLQFCSTTKTPFRLIGYDNLEILTYKHRACLKYQEKFRLKIIFHQITLFSFLFNQPDGIKNITFHLRIDFKPNLSFPPENIASTKQKEKKNNKTKNESQKIEKKSFQSGRSKPRRSRERFESRITTRTFIIAKASDKKFIKPHKASAPGEKITPVISYI